MKLQLKNITLLCVNGVNPNNGVRALKHSMKDIDFAEVKILSHIQPDNLSNNISFCAIDKMTHSRLNTWAHQELYKYVIQIIA